jgi:hypothetical protein
LLLLEYLGKADELRDFVDDFDECLEADDQITGIALAIQHAHKGEDKVCLQRLGSCRLKV